MVGDYSHPPVPLMVLNRNFAIEFDYTANVDASLFAYYLIDSNSKEFR